MDTELTTHNFKMLSQKWKCDERLRTGNFPATYKRHLWTPKNLPWNGPHGSHRKCTKSKQTDGRKHPQTARLGEAKQQQDRGRNLVTVERWKIFVARPKKKPTDRRPETPRNGKTRNFHWNQFAHQQQPVTDMTDQTLGLAPSQTPSRICYSGGSADLIYIDRYKKCNIHIGIHIEVDDVDLEI